MVLVCLVLAASAVPAAVPLAGADSGPADGALAPADVDPDTVRILVDVRDDGTAEWRVEYRVALDDENRTEAFESLESDIQDDPGAYESDFRELMQPSVDQAADETGREMALRNVSVATSREFAPPTGVVAYEFEWTSFAATEGDRLLVGDAIRGFYVSEETILRIEWPDGYALERAEPQPDERSDDGVEWHGRTAFGSEEPRLDLVPGPGAGDGAVPVPLSLAAAAAVALVATLGLVGRVRGGEAEDAAPEVSTSEAGGETAEADGETSAGPPPEDLLSNEERVIAALENHGGRMKQQELADRLDWGAPKTSRVVGSLREDDAVEVFRLGRENVVTLPEEDLLS